MSDQKIAVVRVRGGIGARHEVNDTLTMLNLHKKNFCVVVPNNEVYMGMIKKVKDYVTYGVIDAETEKELIAKRLRKTGDTPKKFFALAPPKKGFGRKGIKFPFSQSGALGNRKEMINDLIRRMI